jgi:DNA segregation ATPase FtsK/SpoIIIE, S-DNA-T family
MTATTENGHRRDLLRKDSDGPVMWDAYPNDPPYDEQPDTGAPTEVDEASTADPNALDSGRPARPAMLPVLPEWARTAGGVRRNVRHAAPILANRTAHHGLRRGYAVRPVGWAFRGGWRLTIRLLRFAVDAETLAMQRKAAREGNGKARAYERKERHKTRRERTAKTAGVLAGVALVAWLLWSPETPFVLRAVLAVGVLTVLVANGLPAPDPDPDSDTRAQVPFGGDPATSLVRSDRVVWVFDKAKIPGVMTVGGTSRRDRDPEGWQAVVDLPSGTTFAEAQARHLNLCSAWPVAKERLYLRRGAHEGQVHMTLFDEDPMLAESARSPLATLGSFCLWDEIPIGTTVFGDSYGLVLPGTAGVWICSAPGMGKTRLVLKILAAGVLARALVLVHDGKGEGDLLAPYGAAAVWATEGCDAAGAKSCGEMLDAVHDLRTERAKKISELRREDHTLMPHGQITPAVTENPEYGLPLAFAAIDELNLLAPQDPKIQERVAGMSQVFRSGGIIPVIAGQRFDADTLGAAQASLGIRVAFRTMNAGESNLVLGTGKVSDGHDTSRWPEHYQGVCLINPAGVQAHRGIQQVKTHILTADDHLRIGRLGAEIRRRDARTAAVERPQAARDLLARVFDAVGSDNVVPVDELAERLGIVDVETLVADLREGHIPVEPSRQHGNRRAVRRRDLPSA